MALRARVLASCLMAALVPSARAAHAQPQQRVVYASALDATGAPRTGLGDADFVVREDRVAREVLTVVPSTDPMQIALLVDNSQAAEQIIQNYREALTAFIRTIGADPTGTHHQVAVITVGERPTINTDYTPDLEQAAKGAQRIFSTPGSGSYLLDGILETVQGIRRRELPRPVIVALTTAGPELSGRVYQQVLDPLQASGAAFHVMWVGPPSVANQDRQFVLDGGTRFGGGRYDTVLAGSALPARMRELARELVSQYKITYVRPQTLIPPERVTVGAARPGLTVRGIAARETGASGK